MREPVVDRTHIPETAVQTFSVIEQLYISENVGLYIFHYSILFAISQLLLYTCKNSFYAAVVIGAYLRALVDEAETHVAKDRWPVPTYSDLLFSKI